MLFNKSWYFNVIVDPNEISMIGSDTEVSNKFRHLIIRGEQNLKIALSAVQASHLSTGAKTKNTEAYLYRIESYGREWDRLTCPCCSVARLLLDYSPWTDSCCCTHSSVSLWKERTER